MELRIWLDDSDIEMLEDDKGLTEQDLLDQFSEVITEWVGQNYGIVLNTETAE